MNKHLTPRRKSAQSGFTLIELMTVISLIVILMGITVGILRYANTKSSREKARAEVAAFAGAAESYKSEWAAYPRSGETDAISSYDSLGEEQYAASSLAFYKLVAGDMDANGVPDRSEGVLNPAPEYMAFKTSQLARAGDRIRYIRDPWDRPSAPSSYGYATKRALLLEAGSDDPAAGRNTTFDVWSRANSQQNSKAWVGNW
jgi:prepilin-type N-terminal cleavage/methylation domain-containing protein